jgi:hypothetical protein
LITARHTPPGSGRDEMKKLLLGMLAAFVATGIVPMASAQADTLSEESSFVAQINGLRASKGLPALGVDAGITAKARGWAQTMADQNRIWHSTLSDGVTADWQKLGENVGMGHTVAGLHVAFVNSPLHYANLVDPTFRSVGIGVVHSASGTLFVAQVFMLTRTAAPSPAVATAPVAPVLAPVVLAATATAPVVKAAAVKAPKLIVEAKPQAAAPATATPQPKPEPETVSELTQSPADGPGRRAAPHGDWIYEF